MSKSTLLLMRAGTRFAASACSLPGWTADAQPVTRASFVRAETDTPQGCHVRMCIYRPDPSVVGGAHQLPETVPVKRYGTSRKTWPETPIR